MNTLPNPDKEIISTLTLDAISTLTESEHHIFILIGKGYKASEIVKARGGGSSSTIESHKNRIKEKLGVQNFERLIVLAARYNLFRAHYPSVVREFVPSHYRFKDTAVITNRTKLV